MLQIITGKFFTTSELYTTHQQGVLYTNYQPEYLKTIDTLVGSISPVTTWGYNSETGVCSLIYKYDERLEAVRPNGQREFLVAVGGDFIIQDFAAVVAFALNVTCTPDLDLTRRLTQAKHPSLGVSNVPDKYVKRVFDQRIKYSEGDDLRLKNFINDLIGLERNTYKAAMRAIRRYVSGLHRIADDLDLAYALLVASIESLAQDFHAFTPTWEDYEHGKRVALDNALEGAPAEIVEGVHSAVLKHEHLALARRYREFALAYLQPSFFREEALMETHPVNRPNLLGALERAYQFRSKYVHILRELPRNITVGPTLTDTDIVDGKPVLTFHGLSRIARHVIREFVSLSPKVEREKFDYRKDLPNIVKMQLDESFWIGRQEEYSHHNACRYLNGFLRQLSAALQYRPGTKMTDISAVVEKIEVCMPGLAKPEQRLPMLTLYLLFHCYVPHAFHRPNWASFINRYSKDFDAPSAESMLAHTLTGNAPDWLPDEFMKVLTSYFKQRYTKTGLILGPLFETAVTLFFAEIFRQRGDDTRARILVREAVENLPGHQSLLEFERSISENNLPPINWQELLLPHPDLSSSNKEDNMEGSTHSEKTNYR